MVIYHSIKKRSFDLTSINIHCKGQIPRLLNIILNRMGDFNSIYSRMIVISVLFADVAPLTIHFYQIFRHRTGRQAPLLRESGCLFSVLDGKFPAGV